MTELEVLEQILFIQNQIDLKLFTQLQAQKITNDLLAFILFFMIFFNLYPFFWKLFKKISLKK